jgi:hypothetical protein
MLNEHQMLTLVLFDNTELSYNKHFSDVVVSDIKKIQNLKKKYHTGYLLMSATSEGKCQLVTCNSDFFPL